MDSYRNNFPSDGSIHGHEPPLHAVLHAADAEVPNCSLALQLAVAAATVRHALCCRFTDDSAATTTKYRITAGALHF